MRTQDHPECLLCQSSVWTSVQCIIKFLNVLWNRIKIFCGMEVKPIWESIQTICHLMKLFYWFNFEPWDVEMETVFFFFFSKKESCWRKMFKLRLCYHDWLTRMEIWNCHFLLESEPEVDPLGVGVHRGCTPLKSYQENMFCCKVDKVSYKTDLMCLFFCLFSSTFSSTIDKIMNFYANQKKK